MKISKQDGQYHLTLSARELVTIKQGLNEALEALDEDEFPARFGIPSSEVEALLRQMTKAYREL